MPQKGRRNKKINKIASRLRYTVNHLHLITEKMAKCNLKRKWNKKLINNPISTSNQRRLQIQNKQNIYIPCVHKVQFSVQYESAAVNKANKVPQSVRLARRFDTLVNRVSHGEKGVKEERAPAKGCARKRRSYHGAISVCKTICPRVWEGECGGRGRRARGQFSRRKKKRAKAAGREARARARVNNGPPRRVQW